MLREASQVDITTQRLPLLLLSLAAALVAVAMAWLFEPAKINPDTIQLIDTARHLLNGEGLTSGIVYYDAQLAFRRVPAPMIIWPPGYPALLAAGLSLGASAAWTAFTLSLAAHLAVAFLIYFALRRVDVKPAIAAFAGFVWLVHPTALNLMISCFAEPLYTAFTLMSFVALVEAVREAGRWRLWLAVAGISAAFAVLMRYNGVLWPAAAGLWLAVLAVHRRSWRPIGFAIAFGLLPAITTVSLFWRNILLSGHISGGQFEYGGAGGIGEVVRRFFWGAELLFGSLLTMQPLVLGLVIGILAGAVFVAARSMRLQEPRALVVGFSLVSTAVLAVFLFGNALWSSIVFVDYRYWMPAIPFLLIVIAVAVDAVAPKRAVVWQATVLASAGALVLSIVIFLATSWPLAQPHPASLVIRQALAERLPDGRALGAVLEADAPRLLLSNEERRLGFVTHDAVIGLPVARYTQRAWDAAAVASLVRELGISQVLFFPSTYEDEFRIPFYRELLEGRVPPWLAVRFHGEQAVLYDVVASELR
jgi:hypothetical protein